MKREEEESRQQDIHGRPADRMSATGLQEQCKAKGLEYSDRTWKK